MAMVISTRKLAPKDFLDWKKRFEAGAAARKDAGCRGVRRFRNVEDPDEVIVIFDWDDHDKARRFIDSNARLIAERDAGAPPPVIHTCYVEELDSLES